MLHECIVMMPCLDVNSPAYFIGLSGDKRNECIVCAVAKRALGKLVLGSRLVKLEKKKKVNQSPSQKGLGPGWHCPSAWALMAGPWLGWSSLGWWSGWGQICGTTHYLWDLSIHHAFIKWILSVWAQTISCGFFNLILHSSWFYYWLWKANHSERWKTFGAYRNTIICII